jgi:hypothetical protein
MDSLQNYITMHSIIIQVTNLFGQSDGHMTGVRRLEMYTGFCGETSLKFSILRLVKRWENNMKMDVRLTGHEDGLWM